MAGTPQNEINNHSRDTFTCDNLTFSGNTITTDSFFVFANNPSDGKEVIITTDTSSKDMQFQLNNTYNNASSTAIMHILINGFAGLPNAYVLFTNNVINWSIGVNSIDDANFVISQNSTLGTNNVLEGTLYGEITLPLTDSFAAKAYVAQEDVTGNNTSYHLICESEIFDQSSSYSTVNGQITASVDGMYQLESAGAFDGFTAAGNCKYSIFTSNRVFNGGNINATLREQQYYTLGFKNAVLAWLDEGDVAYPLIQIDNQGGDVIDVVANASIHAYTFFTGNLEA